MKIQLYSINHAPGWVPIWQVILDDLGNPPPRRVARVLGISERTAYRYSETGEAPRACLLALYWLTSWGRAEVHAQAVADAQMACGYVSSLRAEVGRLESQVAHLLALGASGAANQPLLRGAHG